MDTLMPFTRPRLIEHGFPCHQVGAETQRERGASSALPPLYFLHVWWARRPLTPSRAAILASLSSPDLSPDEFLRLLGIEQRVIDIGDETWVLTGNILDRIRRADDGTEVLPVDAVVLRRFDKEQARRAKARTVAAELERADATLGNDPILLRWKRDCRSLPSQWVRQGTELTVDRRPGDPALITERIEFAKSKAVKAAHGKILNWDAEDLYGYERAFTNSIDGEPNELVVLDPTAGGGSIPFEALRLGHRVIANELNPVAATILYATLDYPARFGQALIADIRDWGDRLVQKVEDATAPFVAFCELPEEEREHLRRQLRHCPELLPVFDVPEHDHVGQLFCRQVTCPTCSGEAPLLNSCWLAKDDEEPWAVRVITDGKERSGKVRFETYRVANGSGPYGEDPDYATVADGVGSCIHCRQAIPEDEIKAQAQGRSAHGRWKDRLYCVAATRFEPKLDANGRPERYKSGERRGDIKTRKARFFRAPNERDLDALAAAEMQLAEKRPAWEVAGLIPTETIPEDSNYNRGHRLYGMTRWCELFMPRQLLGHVTLVEELRRLTPEIITALGEARGRAVITYLQFAIDKGADYNSSLTRWLGPPVGWPIQYRVSGLEPDPVRAIAFKVAQEIGSAPGAENVNYNWMEPARTIRIRVDQDQARQLGLSSQQLALSLNAVVSGVTATQMRSGIYLVDVLVRASAEQRMSLSTIRTLQVPLPNGRTVPLTQIASVDYDQEYPIVWRRDRRPTVTVQADVAPGTQAATVVQALAPKIAALNATLPSGYRIDLGGTVEESSKAQNSVAAVLPMMLVLILTVLMIQLQSFSRLFLVLSVAPLGLLGVVAALLLSGKPLGFVAILGVLALTGMIARNSVILIDQVESEKAKGRGAWDAVVEATMHRFRPILLTASAAILGMVPIAPTVFWGPMAYAIMGGLAVATLLTLIFLPALYVAWFRVKSPRPSAPQDTALATDAIPIH
jgi:hypothetical protein